MADDNKNLAGDTERTSILPQSEPQVADQTEVLPTGASQAQTAQLPPVTQQEGVGAFAGPPLESVAESSTDVQSGDEAVAAGPAAARPASTKASWRKRAAIAGAAAAILSVGFGVGIITHAAIVGDGQDFYEQGYEDGYNDQGYGDEDGDVGPRGQQEPGDVQQQGPGNGQREPGDGQQHGSGGQKGPGSGQQQGPGSQQGDTGSTRPGRPPEGGRGPGSKSGSQGSADTSTQNEGTTAS